MYMMLVTMEELYNLAPCIQAKLGVLLQMLLALNLDNI
jgi:hypothetical protein